MTETGSPIRAAGGRPAYRSRFLPTGLLVIHPTGAQSVAEHARLQRLGAFQEDGNFSIPAAYTRGVVEDLCRRQHEVTHYEQHTTTALGALFLRLRASRRFAAVQALEDCVRSYGRVRSLAGLVAVETARTGNFIAASNVLSDDGVRNLQFWEFVTRVEAALMGTVWQQDALKMTWDALFGVEVLPKFLGLGRGGGFAHKIRLTVDPGAPTFVKGQTSLNNLLEASARLREFQIWVDNSADAETVRGYLVQGDSTYWYTILKTAYELDVAVSHPIVRVLHDVALQVFPDPELLTGSQVFELDWNRDYPGRFFDRALGTLKERKVPKRMNTAEAYDLVASTMLDDGSLPYHAALAGAHALEPVEDLLERRQQVSTESWLDVHLAVSQTFLDDFAGLTLSAALRLRSEDPAVFSYIGLEGTDQALSQSQRIRLQPFMLHDEGFDTYPSVTADPVEHVHLVADAIFEIAIDELADAGSCWMATRVCDGISATYGESMLSLVVALVGARLPSVLSELVTSQLGGAGNE